MKVRISMPGAYTAVEFNEQQGAAAFRKLNEVLMTLYWQKTGTPAEHTGQTVTRPILPEKVVEQPVPMKEEQPEAPEEQRKHRWIPVDERLPEDGTYLCTLDGELCGLDEPFTGMCGIENGKWDEEGCVIAWMPLPKPYRPEE